MDLFTVLKAAGFILAAGGVLTDSWKISVIGCSLLAVVY